MLQKSAAELAIHNALLRIGFINWMGGVFTVLYEEHLWHFAYVLQMRLRHLIQAINQQNCNPLFHFSPLQEGGALTDLLSLTILSCSCLAQSVARCVDHLHL